MDIFLSVLQAVVAAIAAYLGVHVTLHPPGESVAKARAYKAGFVACGLAAISLIALQAYRNDQAQSALKGQLFRIERNTKTPPTVQVTNNVPPVQVVVQPPVISKPMKSPGDTQRGLTQKEIADMAEVLPRGNNHCIAIAAPPVPNEADRTERKVFGDSLARPFKKALWDIVSGYNQVPSRDWSGIKLLSGKPDQPDMMAITRTFDQAPRFHLVNGRNDPDFNILLAGMYGAYNDSYPDGARERILNRPLLNLPQCPVLYVGEK